jgi:hypothetical protein
MVRLSRQTSKEVLIASRRRCCLCVFLRGLDEECRGQIAHLDRNPSNSNFGNLVFLCLVHHDEYDSRTSQSKGLMVEEVRQYRDQLYERHNQSKMLILEGELKSSSGDDAENSGTEALQQRLPEQFDYIADPWRFALWQCANEPEFFAYKASNRCDGICLIERINLPDKRIVVACIETAGNPGCSITNAVEELCFQVCRRFSIAPERLVWLEHYVDDPSEWRRVTFDQYPPLSPAFEGPKWTTMTRPMWRDLKLRPKSRMVTRFRQFESKIEKLFDWPNGVIDEDD